MRRITTWLLVLICFLQVFPCKGRTCVDAPIVENIRFFKIPDSQKSIAFNFDKSEYVILEDNKVCGYFPCTDYGKFSVGTDSLLVMDHHGENDNIVIAMNDGTESGMRLEAFDSAGNRSLPFSHLTFKFNDDDRIYHKFWNIDYRPFAEAITLDSNMPCQIGVFTFGKGITISLTDNCEKENTVRYYPVYKLQGKPANKILIYVNRKDYGARSCDYAVTDGEFYLVTSHGRRTLEEIMPGEMCTPKTKRKIFLDDRWPVTFRDPEHVPDLSIKEIF